MPAEHSLRLRDVRLVVIFPATHIYGMERSTLELVRQLRMAGAKVCLLVNELHGGPVREIADGFGVEYATAQLWHKLERPKSVRHAVDLFRDWWSISGRAKRAVEQFDATHVLCPGLEFFLYSLRVSGRAKRIFALPNAPDRALRGWKGWVYRTLWKHLVVRRTSALICNSRYTQEELECLVGTVAHSRVIYRCAPARNPNKPAPAINRFGLNLLFVGQLAPMKGPHLIIEACEKLIAEGLDIGLTIAGAAHSGEFAQGLIPPDRARPERPHSICWLR